VAAVLAACSVADARPRRRGPSPDQIKAMQSQMSYMQLKMIRYQAEIAQKNQEIYKSFDQDGDGMLQGGEKARYDRHLHAIQTGKAPNPFATIQPVGKGPRPKSPVDELKRRAAEYKSDVVAKQQELFSSFDENGNGHLEGPEKSKFDKLMNDIQSGKAPNPFAVLAAPNHEEPGSTGRK
jgi:hypothetical protein